VRKRNKPSEGIAAMHDLRGAFEGLSRIIQPTPATATAPAPAPAPAPAALSNSMWAVQQLLRKSKEHGKEWLSVDAVHRMITIFGLHEHLADIYLVLISDTNDNFIQQWVLDQLPLYDMQGTDSADNSM
jgi:hypothetical protein